MSARRATLVGTILRSPDRGELGRLSGRADVLEVRADALDADPGAAALRDGFSGSLLYTLRSRAEGGRGPERFAERQERLAAASATFDLVDLEAERDLEPALLDRVPPERRVISWHGPAAELEELRSRLHAMSRHPARLYKLVPSAGSAREILAPLALARSERRADLVAFAGGAAGAWTRLLALRLGAPWAFAAAQDVPGAPGQPSLERLREDYGLPELGPLERLCGVVGRPVDDSLSPRLHNAAYRELGIPALYLAFEPPTFGDFWLDAVESGSLGVLGFDLVGLSVTAPYKEVAQAVAGASSPLAERIGSANTLVRSGGVWEAECTDPRGLLRPLEELGAGVSGRAAVVVGAGGAARAAAFALGRAGARVTLANRGLERGRRVAAHLGVGFVPLSELDPAGFDLLVNATPLGRSEEDPLPFELEALAGDAVVVDLAYRRGAPTRLVREVRSRGRMAVDGREVLLHQAVPQFLLMTGRELPLATGRRALGLGDPG